MESGKLKFSISIQEYSEVVTSSGDVTKSWVEVAAVRADILPVRANEKISTGQTVISIEALKFIIRADQRIYADNGSDSGTKLRIVHRSVNYDVRSIAPLYNVRGLELLAERTK